MGANKRVKLILCLAGVLPLIAQARSLPEFSKVPPRAAILSYVHRTVLDGRISQPEDNFWRFTTRISLTDDSGKFVLRCTGVFWQPRVVLTSAHCFPDSITKATVHFDPDGDNKRRISIDAQSFERHPAYVFPKSNRATTSDGVLVTNWERKNQLHQYYFGGDAKPLTMEPGDAAQISSVGNDIAMIYLEQEVGYPFQPISFAPSSIKVDENEVFYVSGYGRIGDLPTDFDEQLRFATYRPVLFASDERNKARVIKSWPRDIAATSAGDSGGPVFILRDGEFYLVGVHSSSIVREFAFSTVPHYHYDWLYDTYQKLSKQNISL